MLDRYTNIEGHDGPFGVHDGLIGAYDEPFNFPLYLLSSQIILLLSLIARTAIIMPSICTVLSAHVTLAFTKHLSTDTKASNNVSL